MEHVTLERPEENDKSGKATGGVNRRKRKEETLMVLCVTRIAWPASLYGVNRFIVVSSLERGSGGENRCERSRIV